MVVVAVTQSAEDGKTDLVAKPRVDPDAFDWPPPELVAGDLASWLGAIIDKEQELSRLITRYQQAVECLSTQGTFSHQPLATKRRYHHSAWQNEPALRLAALSHDQLFTALQDQLNETAGLDRQIRRRLEFWLKQMEVACCPAYAIALSPEVRDAAIASQGQSLRRGLDLLQQDFANSRYRLRMARQPKAAFRLGVDLAATPCELIWQNELIELICYHPTAESAGHQRSGLNETPLLIVPPCINRHYVLDLSPRSSFVRWCLAQGQSVYMIVWREAAVDGPDWEFDDYVTQGIEAAYVHVCRHAGVCDLHMLAYCIGGTLAVCHLAWRAAQDLPQPRSLTLLTTLVDFAEPGELGVFISEDQLDRLEVHLQSARIMSGNLLRQAFELLQPEELMWSQALRRYGMGLENKPHELMFWSDDNPALPARMIMDYLRTYYLDNQLIQPGAVSIQGWAIDLALIQTPILLVAAESDHIAPWQSVFAGSDVLPSANHFILAAGGHIGGIINPPGRQRLNYRSGALPQTLADWQQTASTHKGSWWPSWTLWLSQQI